jgi:hypothetical protein
MAEGVGKGALAGAGKGASLGSTLGSIIPIPGVGSLVGGAIGAGVGAIAGGVGAKKTAKEREKGLQLPGTEDPTQMARRAEIDRMAKNVAAGTDSATQTALDKGQQTTAATQSRLSRITGGNVGATTDALLKAQRAGGDAANQAIAQGQSRLPFFMNLGQQLSNRIEQRKLDLDLLARDQTSAETAQRQKEANVNANAVNASGMLGDLGGSSKRIQSLMNQGIGKLQGDMAGISPTEIAPISQNIKAPDLSSVIGGATEAIPEIGGLGAFTGSIGG